MITVGHDRPTTPPNPHIVDSPIFVPSSFSSVTVLSPTPLPPSTTIPSLPPSPSPPPALSSPPPLDSDAIFPGIQDAQPTDSLHLDMSDDVYFDDQALSSLEKIYLFSRSNTVLHRVFISRSLHTFLTQVSPSEAVEYVLPLLNALATDHEDVVKEALVTNLVAIMWWFFENCSLVQDEPPEDPHDPPLLPVQTFTPILGSLLINLNNIVGGPARSAVVESLNRLQAAETEIVPHPNFGPKQRQMLQHEIIHHVIIGMARLDSPPESSHILSPPHSKISSSLPASSDCTEPPIPELSTPSPPSSSTLPDPLITSVLQPVGISLSPGSPPQPPPSQESISHLSFTPASPPSTNTDTFTDWLPQTPHPNSETTPENTTTVTHSDHEAEEDGWVHGLDSQEQQAAVGRCSSMSLIATVTANTTLPQETTCAFTSEVVRICKDPQYWVRREASFALGALAKVVPLELVQISLLPLFDALTHDPVWHVRHSAIFALPGILARLTPQHRRTLARDTLFALARDVAPTVRSGVLEVLGEVIYTFHEDDGGPPAEIVAMFVGDGVRAKTLWSVDAGAPEVEAKAESQTQTLSSVFESDEESSVDPTAMFGPSLPPPPAAPEGFFRDPARALITSFNYPAVALALGPQRWDEVRGYYLSLTRDTNLRVRRTIAAGLGEMARILGDAYAQRDLVEVWEALVHDAEDGETRLRALRGVGLFVGALRGEGRMSVVGGLVELWEQWLDGWRERECLAGALADLAGLVGAQGEVVRTLLARALVDCVAAVREAAIAALLPILAAFEDRPYLVDEVRDDLQSLACADSCRRRATYVACYRSLLESDKGEAEVSRDDFWERIVPLSQDAIIDVRIGVARLLGKICDKFYPDVGLRPPRVSEVVCRLGRDPSRDVRAFVEYLFVPSSSDGAHTKSQAQLGGRDSVPRPASPPVLFATFSRPPPRTPPLGAMAERMKDLGIREEGCGSEHKHLYGKNSGPEAHVAISGREGDLEGREQENVVKPLPLRRRRSFGDWNPS